MSNRKGFTLIELLIVVAIIGILAAIAIPNFLQAQVRAKVARNKSEMAAVSTALEAYHVDNGKYPPMSDLNDLDWKYAGFHSRLSSHLTSPIPYIAKLPLDPFVDHDNTWWNNNYPPETKVGQRYVYYDSKLMISAGTDVWNGLVAWVGLWLVYGYGPDKTPFHGGSGTLLPYDPTNGTVSMGNVIRCQKRTDGIPLHPITGTYYWN